MIFLNVSLMIKKIKIILINRPSMSDPSLPSRSSSARLYTLLTYLQKKNIVEFKMVELNDITLGLTKKYDFFLFNKHFTEEAYDKLRLINELGKITIYDIDDYLFKLPSYSVTKIDSVKIEIISN